MLQLIDEEMESNLKKIGGIRNLKWQHAVKYPLLLVCIVENYLMQ